MRFITGFIFFGLFFYAMSIYFPEAFHTLVTWAAALFNFIQEAIAKIMNQPPSHAPVTVPAPKSLAVLFDYLRS